MLAVAFSLERALPWGGVQSYQVVHNLWGTILCPAVLAGQRPTCVAGGGGSAQQAWQPGCAPLRVITHAMVRRFLCDALRVLLFSYGCPALAPKSARARIQLFEGQASSVSSSRPPTSKLAPAIAHPTLVATLMAVIGYFSCSSIVLLYALRAPQRRATWWACGGPCFSVSLM
jgi:hypothetical protein